MPAELATEFDVVVVGGGINGLTTAAYLAKSGLSVVVIERRDQLGTHAVTEEQGLPNWRQSTHATAMATGVSPSMLDLELERFGLGLVVHRLIRGQAFMDGKALVWDKFEPNNFYKKVRSFSTKDAATFKKIFNHLEPSIVELARRFYYSPPSPENWDYIVNTISNVPGIPQDWWDMSGLELLDFLYEDDHFKAYLAGWANTWGMTPSSRLIGALSVLFVQIFNTEDQIFGGSHQVPHALFRCIIHYGGKILQSCEVEKIIVKDDHARGVMLGRHSAYSEKIILARKAVISDLSTELTFGKLLEEDQVGSSISRHLRYNWNYSPSLFTACYLTTDALNWKASSYDSDMQNVWEFSVGGDTMKDVEEMYTDVARSKIPNPPKCLTGCFDLSMYDETSAPTGMHSLMFWADMPFRVSKFGSSTADTWDDIKQDVLSTVTELVEGYAPGFKKMTKESIALTPLDCYRKNPSAINGTTHAGSLKPGQFYFDRPFLGCKAPRTPIEGLYLSNGAWPLGQTSLATGYNAAVAVIEDLAGKLPNWWMHAPGEWYGVWALRNKVEMKTRVTI